MYFGSVTLVALALALATRRPVGRLIELRFRRIGILWLAIALRLLFVPGALYSLWRAVPFPGLPAVGSMIYVSSFLLVVLFAWFNRRIVGVSVIGLGLLMNAAVIGTNGGQMPVDPGQVAAIGQLNEFLDAENRGEWSTFTVMKPETRLAFLGDRFPVPMPFKEPSILSLGDLAITAGILLFFFVIPTDRPSPSPSEQRA